jgi:hypothetical protein
MDSDPKFIQKLCIRICTKLILISNTALVRRYRFLLRITGASGSSLSESGSPSEPESLSSRGSENVFNVDKSFHGKSSDHFNRQDTIIMDQNDILDKLPKVPVSCDKAP